MVRGNVTGRYGGGGGGGGGGSGNYEGEEMAGN